MEMSSGACKITAARSVRTAEMCAFLPSLRVFVFSLSEHAEQRTLEYHRLSKSQKTRHSYGLAPHKPWACNRSIKVLFNARSLSRVHRSYCAIM
jgi:hypothetical protein